MRSIGYVGIVPGVLDHSRPGRIAGEGVDDREGDPLSAREADLHRVRNRARQQPGDRGLGRRRRAGPRGPTGPQAPGPRHLGGQRGFVRSAAQRRRAEGRPAVVPGRERSR